MTASIVKGLFVINVSITKEIETNVKYSPVIITEKIQ